MPTELKEKGSLREINTSVPLSYPIPKNRALSRSISEKAVIA